MESHSKSLPATQNARKQRKGKGSKPFIVACRLSEKDFEQLTFKMSLQKKTTQEFLEKLILNDLNQYDAEHLLEQHFQPLFSEIMQGYKIVEKYNLKYSGNDHAWFKPYIQRIEVALKEFEEWRE